jgi:hypothetical protein
MSHQCLAWVALTAGFTFYCFFSARVFENPDSNLFLSPFRMKTMRMEELIKLD